MVFLESQQIGWYALVKSYIKTVPSHAIEHAYLDDLLRIILDCSLAWCRKFGKFPIYRSEMTVVKNMLALLQTYVCEWSEGDEAQKQKNINPNEVKDIITKAILFAVVWSIGGALDENCRKSFNSFLLKLISAADDIAKTFEIQPQYQVSPITINVKLQERANLFDMVFDRAKNNFIAWTQTQPPFVIPK